MTNPPIPAAPIPEKKSSKKVWIILGIIFGVIVVFCGGCFAVTGAFFNEVDKAIEEEEQNDKPTEIEEGGAFTHDDWSAEAGWTIGNDGLDDFTVEGLKVTNDADDARTAFLDILVYRGNEQLGEISCSSNELQPGDKATLDCSSLEAYTQDYDTVKVRDGF